MAPSPSGWRGSTEARPGGGTESAARAERVRPSPRPRRDTHMNRGAAAAARPGKKDPLPGLLRRAPEVGEQAPRKASLPLSKHRAKAPHAPFPKHW